MLDTTVNRLEAKICGIIATLQQCFACALRARTSNSALLFAHMKDAFVHKLQSRGCCEVQESLFVRQGAV